MRTRLTTCLLPLLLLCATAAPVAAQEGHGLLQATPAPAGAEWRVVDERALELDASLVTLSPDGQWIAGINPDRQFCVWEVATLDPACDTSGVRPDERSLRWAPDSSAVAWTGDALMFFEDTDIMVFELAAGQSTNLTDDGYDGSQIAREGNRPSTMPVDVFPAWTPDSQALVFARTDAVLEDQQPTDLMQVARDGGPPEFLHAAHPAMPLSVNTPIHVLAGGTVLFAVASTDPGDDLNGVWRLDPDGEATMLLPGNRADPFPLPSIVDVGEGANGPIATGFSRSPSDILAPFGFTLDVGTGEVTPNERDPETLLQPVAVTFAPDASTTVALVLAGAAGQLVVTSPDGSASDLGEVEATSWTLERGIDWAATDTLLLPYREGGGMLLTVTRDAG